MTADERIYDPVEKDFSLDDELLRLIKDCIAQDRIAQRRLYDKFSGMLFGIIRRYEASLEMAEEILNDTFTLIFTRLEQYSFSGSFEGWIRRIAINCTTNYFRKNAKHKKVISSDFQTIDPYVDSNAASKLYYKELLQIIHTIPDMQRTVFNLFVFEEQTHKDIARVLDISEGYSKWYLNDARKKIKEKISSMK